MINPIAMTLKLQVTSQGRGTRQGSILVITIISLILLSAVVANLVRSLILFTNESAELSKRSQLQVLVDDALAISASRLTVENQTDSLLPWSIAAAEWSLPEAGRVEFSLQPQGEGRVLLTAVGTLQSQDQVRQKLTKTIIVNFNPEDREP